MSQPTAQPRGCPVCFQRGTECKCGSSTPINVDELGAWLKANNASLSMHVSKDKWHARISLFDPPNTPHQADGVNKDFIASMFSALHEALRYKIK